LDGEIWLSINTMQLRIDRDSVHEFFNHAIHRPGTLRPTIRTTSGDTQLRELSADHQGLLLLTAFDAERSRVDVLEELSDVMAQPRGPVRARFSRDMGTGLYGWPDIVGRTFAPQAPFTANDHHGHFVLRTFHLLDDYVYDAYPVQILNASQFAKTHLDPERWQVRELGDGSYSVAHADPDAWFAPTDDLEEAVAWRMDPTVLAQARGDFADAIITPELLFENPPPMPPGWFDAMCQRYRFNPDPKAIAVT
jgi:hypothetical protein